MRGVGSLFDLRLFNLSRSCLAVDILVLGIPFVVILSPLVVVSAHLAGVLLVVVLVGVDEIVGFAPPGVEVRAGSLLGPRVVIVTGLSSSTTSRSLVVLVRGSGVSPLGSR